MGWFPEYAANAYLDTIKLCRLDHDSRANSTRRKAARNTEFLAALAAGMNAQLMIEVSSSVSQTTIALAAAARQTGGCVILILSNSEALLDAMMVLKELGLSSFVEFIVGDAKEIIPEYRDVDFVLIDCKMEEYVGVFDLLNLNPACAVVVADNLFDGEFSTDYGQFVAKRPGASSITLPIGKGVQVTRFSRDEENRILTQGGGEDDDNRRLRSEVDSPRDGRRRVRFFIESRNEMKQQIRIGVTGWS